ncbi:ABC transporter permease [Photobacterium halotolerans]|uniref:Peptide ABC transporter permease n=1 Tax=Photobacterium halotolerans TaxID=265726 RepID=A0A0F5VFE8_9GAMM|nr:ABC transporter permease [Photobacterium halotolerans]KKD00778.1 peptide ABC transporter permease [Photobacterium halotolerans]
MSSYIAKRLGMLCGILFGVLTITFFLTRVLPSSPVEMMLGSKPTQEQIAEATIALGLDKPLIYQYADYLGKALTGDLGNSLRTGQSVVSDIGTHMTATIELVTIAILVSVLMGVPVGVFSAVRKNTLADQASRAVSLMGIAVPSFFLAIILQMVFYGWLGWFPLQGRIASAVFIEHPFPSVTGFYLLDTLLDGQWQAFKSAALHLILPVMSLSLATFAIFVRTTRNLMVEVLNQDYIRTSHAFGMPKRTTHFIYALKATLVPLLTVVGLTYGFMLGNSVIVEFVFDWPGIGRYVVDSVITNDFPAVMGVTLALSGSYLLVNVIVDLIYFAVDPRLSVKG